MTKTLINKAKKSDYPKDKLLLGFYRELEEENKPYFNGKNRKQLALLICLWSNNGKTSIGRQSCTVLRHPLNSCMQTLQTLDF